MTQGHHDEGAGELPAVREVKARYEKRLLSLPGVISVGIGRSPDGSSVIIVGLDRNRPATIQEIPEEIEGYPVRVETIGPVHVL